MSTLVIHPYDPTTIFLSTIYQDKNWEVVNGYISNSGLKSKIKGHEKIIMLGHGSSHGLFGNRRMMIDSSLVYLLREKECVGVWCNADQFFNKYRLKGFHTGMIISEYEEAIDFSIQGFTSKDIEISNQDLANSIKVSIDKLDILDNIKKLYVPINPIMDFNYQNLFYNGKE